MGHLAPSCESLWEAVIDNILSELRLCRLETSQNFATATKRQITFAENQLYALVRQTFKLLQLFK